MNLNPLKPCLLARNNPFKGWLVPLTAILLCLPVLAPAQRINLNFTATGYTDASETSPATPEGPAGTWNNISLAAANADVAVTYADGSPGPTLAFDIGKKGVWNNTMSDQTATYTGAGAVYAVPNLYESGFNAGDNLGGNFRLRGLAPGMYVVHLIPMLRNFNAAGGTQLTNVFKIGTGNDTDDRDSGDATLVTTDASARQYIDTSLTTWVPATDGSTPYNYLTATVNIDSTHRWLTFLLTPHDGNDPDRPGISVIQIEPTDSVPSPAPVITQAILSQQGLILRGSNGPASSAYQVLAGTNVTLPASNWPAISTNAFDIIGHFDSTNPVTPGLKQQFFRLLVGGTLPPPPTAPSITNQPQSLTVGVGATANFLVGATGDAPLTYFWSLNTNTPVGGNSSTLALVNVQTNNAGSYRVIVSNAVGVVTSSVVTLTVLSSPVITLQPQSQSVTVSNDAMFTVTATGAAPLHYQWFFNTNTPVGVNSNGFTRLNAQTNDAGSYSVIVTNNYGSVTSTFAMLTIGATVTNNAQFNLVGFGQGTTGGGVIAENNSAYRKVTTPLEFATAVRDANKTANSVLVIEIMNNLDLGWNEVGTAVQTLASTPFASALAPKLHPALLTSGVSVIYIDPKGTGLTIFSANGSTIRHATFSIKATSNIMVRNLKFDELWEWDEESAGGYDQNNWDFIDLSVGGGTVDHVWIDHCTFTKSYDGIADNKGGVSSVTYSWNKYMGDDGATNPNSFVWQQINSLESNKVAYPMYNFLRTHGFSTTNIVTILQGPDKTTAIGELSMKDVNTNASLTFHHQWYINCWDRLPRLAGGTAHNFNIYVDDTLVLAARRLRDAIHDAMSPADRLTFDNNYSFKPPINGSISTENGALLVEKSVYIDCNWPLRNNQTDPSNPIYTGKIKALDTIYQYDSTFVRGNSTDPANPLGPFQAPIIPFSWNTNGVTPNGQLPYTYTMDDPSQLQSIVTSPTAGAGSGVLTWNKTNWMKTTY